MTCDDILALEFRTGSMRLDHVVFPVRDPLASMRFYRKVLGLPLIAANEGDDWGGFPWLMLIFGLPSGQEIVCVALSGAESPDYGNLPPDARHYAIALGDDAELDAWRARLQELSVDHWVEDHGGRRSIYFSDPDGVVLELTLASAPPQPAEDKAALQKATAWCARCEQTGSGNKCLKHDLSAPGSSSPTQSSRSPRWGRPGARTSPILATAAAARLFRHSG